MEVETEIAAGAPIDGSHGNSAVGAQLAPPIDASGYKVMPGLIDPDDPRIAAAREFAFAHKIRRPVSSSRLRWARRYGTPTRLHSMMLSRLRRPS